MAVGNVTDSRNAAKAPTAKSNHARNAEAPAAPGREEGPVQGNGDAGPVDRVTVDPQGDDVKASSDVVGAAADASLDLTGPVEETAPVEHGVPLDESDRAATIHEALSDNFGDFDADGNGYLNEAEIAEALQSGELNPNDRAALSTLRGRQGEFQVAHNDEYFAENDGITLNDIDAFENSGTQDARIVAEQFRIEQELARETPTDPSLRDIPADLSDITGTRDFYLERYADFRRRNPDQAAPSYYLDYGLKYFDRFHENKHNYAPATQGWVNRTGRALQEAMETSRLEDPAVFAELERDPAAFREFAYATHPDAYVNAGLTQVPFDDRLRILGTPDVADLFNREGLWQAAEVAARVTRDDVERAAAAVEEGFNFGVFGFEQGILEMMRATPGGF